ncbi:hypothetical protein [Arthrobacter sp. ISL-30]|uniref:hypothetical protein n=1 Tax=Arthrobacter sp. ISL-30 TaxID=2819109 RepID=UPI001BE7B1F0|nr:hypothetical protein [Arthrobacter sp. ISL-30]MBT2513072.1 hypothetical protein [Arthrobacter sp. ISL-30]
MVRITCRAYQVGTAAAPSAEGTARGGNVVVLEGATKGTFTGPMMTADEEVPPSGKSCEAPLVAVCELSDTGLSMACREYYDTAAFAAQLGMAG